jgi:hypothetical protein
MRHSAEPVTAASPNDSKLELDGLKIAVDPLAADGLQGAEQSIALHMITLTFGHIDIA